MDLFIEALYRLNQRMKTLPAIPPTVVAFIITRAATRNINVGVLQNQSMFDDLRNTCDGDAGADGPAAVPLAPRPAASPTYPELLPDDAQVRLKRAMHAWRTTPPAADRHARPGRRRRATRSLKHLRHRGLFNAADDPVKMVFHPEFVTRDQPADQPGLRAVRPRLPPGHLPELLRAVGLHADGVRSRWACPR